MEREWLVITGGRQYGPLSKDELKACLQQKRCAATDSFWRQGMSEWEPLAQIPELKELAGCIPPDTSHLPPGPGEMSNGDSEFSSKKIAAGLLGILLGAFGVHKFFLGYTKEGTIMLVVSLVGLCVAIPTIVMGIIGLVEGIMYLCLSDKDFIRLHKSRSHPWF